MPTTSLINGIKFSKNLLSKHGPKYACIQLTNRCNMKCSFCKFWTSKSSSKDELTVDDYKRFSEELSRFGFLLTTLEGGEPFIRDDIVDIVRAFAKNHLVIIYTNGWRMSPELADELFEAGLHQIAVSVDYPDAKRHDHKRGCRGAFDRAWKTVRCLRDAAPYGDKQVSILTVLMKDNLNDIERLLTMAGDYGVGFGINLLSIHGFYRAHSQENQLPKIPVSNKLVKLRKKYSNFRVFKDYLKMIDRFLEEDKLPLCRSGTISFNVDPYGNVSPCIEKTKYAAGNIQSESFEKIYNRLMNTEIVRNCQDCWTLCRGLGQIMGNRGNISGWWDMITRMRVG